MKFIRCIVLLFSGCFLIFSCTENGPDLTIPPEGILNKEKTAEIMAFTYLAEATLQHNNTQPIEKRKQIRFNVCNELNTTEEIYQNSLKFYSMHPEQLKQIHELALEKINQMKKEKK